MTAFARALAECPGKRMPAAHGSALVISLVLVTIVGLLGAAAMRTATVESLNTASFANWTQTRLHASSAIEAALAADSLPATGDEIRSWTFDPNGAYRATTTISYLGQTRQPSTDDQSADMPAPPAQLRQHYRIVAEVIGPRGTRVVRRRYFSRPRRGPGPSE